MSIVLFTDISRTTIDSVKDSFNNVVVCRKFKVTVNRWQIAKQAPRSVVNLSIGALEIYICQSVKQSYWHIKKKSYHFVWRPTVIASPVSFGCCLLITALSNSKH